jgi:hypothetical protein
MIRNTAKPEALSGGTARTARYIAEIAGHFDCARKRSGIDFLVLDSSVRSGDDKKASQHDRQTRGQPRADASIDARHEPDEARRRSGD